MVGYCNIYFPCVHGWAHYQTPRARNPRGAMLHVLRALHCLRALRLLRVDLRPMLPQRLERNLWQPMATFCCLLFVSCAFVCFSFPLLLLFSPKKRFSSFGQSTSRPVRGVPLCPIWEVIRAIFLASRVPTKTKRNEYPVKPTKLQDQF